MPSQPLRPYFLLMLLAGATILAALILAPFLKPLALAAVFAVVLQGLYVRISRLFGGRASLASLATVVVSLLLILLPLSVVAVMIGNEAHDLYVSLETGQGQDMIAGFLGRIEGTLGSVPGYESFTRGASTDIATYAKNALQWIVRNAGTIFSSFSSLLLSSFVFLIALFYLLRDGKLVRKTLIALSPMNDRDDEEVFVRLERAVNSIIKGNLVVALVQGVVATVGFTLFGVPHAMLWGTITTGAALIPGIGTALVFLPIILFLYVTGASGAALGLLIWGSLAVGLVDNLLGPKLIGGGMQLHPLLVLLSVLGGVSFFGPVGIFLGPLSLSLLFALLGIYVGRPKT